MAIKNKIIQLLLLTVSLLFLPYCKSSEPPLTVIEGDPQAASADTSVAGENEKGGASFMQISIGEIHPIKSMDPLFATNTSTKRFVQQVYEGLVRYNAEGDIVPAIASEWMVSDDSLTYRFHLRKNAYYHDSEVFAAGTGQRVVSDDFRFIFQRMAKSYIPPTAPHLFMSIEGFEPYYQEQHRLFNPDDRKLTDISGIETPSDTTLVLRLREKDPHLLQKLASPYAVAYPRQAVNNTDKVQRITRAVGSGPFQFSQQKSDSLIILARFNGYWANRNAPTRTPRLNRIDFKHRSEKQLYRGLSNGEIDLIPELGPSLMQQVIDTSGQLDAGNKISGLDLYKGSKFTYRLLYNKNFTGTQPAVQREIHKLDLEQLTSNIHPAGIKIQYKRKLTMADPASTRTTALEIPYSDDPFIRAIGQQMKESFERQSVNFRMNDLRVPLSTTSLVADQQMPVYPHQQTPADSLTLVRFKVQHYALSKNSIRQFQINDFPWWLNLRQVTVQTPDENL